MDETSIRRLNEINRAFYAAVADDFDSTRGRPWPGWQRVGSAAAALRRQPLTVLDAGCGNGRFGVFLADRLRSPVNYAGIDNNAALLARARERLAACPTLTATLSTGDLVAAAPDEGQYDLVVLFGVLHHVPGRDRRLALMAALGARVAPGGLLAFSCWRFHEYERFRQRVVPWPPDLTAEPGDYLLDWRRGARALRYCHYVDDAEHAALAGATVLRPVADYRADGHSGDANRYSILAADGETDVS